MRCAVIARTVGPYIFYANDSLGLQPRLVWNGPLALEEARQSFLALKINHRNQNDVSSICEVGFK